MSKQSLDGKWRSKLELGDEGERSRLDAPNRQPWVALKELGGETPPLSSIETGNVSVNSLSIKGIQLWKVKVAFIDGAWWKLPRNWQWFRLGPGRWWGRYRWPGRGSREEAIQAAVRAAVALRKMSSLERRQMLEALVAGVKERQTELAQTIVAEGGKPISFARGEVSRGLMTLSIAAEEAERLGRGAAAGPDPGQRRPLGDHPALSRGAGVGDYAV